MKLRLIASFSKESYIKYVKNHKNSQGEDAPWCIFKHDTDKLLSSYPTKAEAEKALQRMHIFKKGSMETSKLSIMAKLDILRDAVKKGLETLDSYSVSTAMAINNLLFQGSGEYLLIEEITEEYKVLELQPSVHVFVKINIEGEDSYLDGTAKPKNLKNALSWFKRTYKVLDFKSSVVKESDLFKLLKNQNIPLFREIEILQEAIKDFKRDAHNDLYREAKSTWYTDIDPVPSLDPEPFFDSVRGKNKPGQDNVREPKGYDYKEKVFDFQKRIVQRLKDSGYSKDKDSNIFPEVAQDKLIMSPLYSRIQDSILTEDQAFKLVVKFYELLKSGTIQKKDCVKLTDKFCSLLKQGVPEDSAYEKML